MSTDRILSPHEVANRFRDILEAVGDDASPAAARVRDLCQQPATTPPASVAIWVYWRDAYMQIIVPRDGRVELHWGAPNDEGGYHSETETYTLEGEYVIRKCHTDGSDCDGRLESFDTHRCHVDNIEATTSRRTGWASLQTPEWERVSGSRRDHAAEAAGY